MRKIVAVIISFVLFVGLFIAPGTEGYASEVDYIPVYRLYNPITGNHLYTTDENERYVLYTSQGWGYEGVAWYSPKTGTGVYRLYNRVLHNHLYTTDLNEINTLTKLPDWSIDNGGQPLFYSGGSTPIYRLYNRELNGMHHLTTDENEYNTLPKYGWSKEGVAFYATKVGVQCLTTYYGSAEQQSMIPNLKVGKAGRWKVTQYGEAGGDRQICYTITNDTQLVIVDGGWEAEETRLRQIIAAYGNHVDAWILTHPDPDHITAFLDIYSDPQGILVDKVYTPEYPSVEVLKTNAPWDDFSALERFRSLKISGHTYLHRGDEVDVIGLKMQVISAYEDRIDEISDDLMNNGALMFKLKGNSESMMFCGDVGSAAADWNTTNSQIMTDYILGMYSPDELKADYVQMAHHGFQGMMPEFYEAVSPKGAFFDAPLWLLEGVNDGYSSKPKYDLMKGLGCDIYTYYSSPNQIVLR